MKKIYILIDLLSRGGSFPLRLTSSLRQVCRRFHQLARCKARNANFNPTTQFDGKCELIGTSNIILGDYCRLGDFVQLGTQEKGCIRLGNNVRLNRGTTFFSYSEISIGDDSLIGEFTTIRDANHGTKKDSIIKSQEHVAAPVKIGKDVWIGRGVCILPGVEIGDGAIIGANSVVTKSIKSYSIAAGVPCKIIKERE